MKNIIVQFKNKPVRLFVGATSEDIFEVCAQFMEEESLSEEDLVGFAYVTHEEMKGISLPAARVESGKILQDKAVIIAQKTEEIRAIRDALLSNNDLPLKIALETENTPLAEKLRKKNKFLRDLPKNLKLNELKISEILSLDPFSLIKD